MSNLALAINIKSYSITNLEAARQISPFSSLLHSIFRLQSVLFKKESSGLRNRIRGTSFMTKKPQEDYTFLSAQMAVRLSRNGTG